MKLIRVINSELRYLGYEDGTLYVKYNNGLERAYFGVSEDVLCCFAGAPEHGRHLSYYIKGYYPSKWLS